MANLNNTEEARLRNPNSASPAANPTAKLAVTAETPVITPAQWARQVLGINEPFGFDRQPTVWG